jgi:hypothetical protein
LPLVFGSKEIQVGRLALKEFGVGLAVGKDGKPAKGAQVQLVRAGGLYKMFHLTEEFFQSLHEKIITLLPQKEGEGG